MAYPVAYEQNIVVYEIRKSIDFPTFFNQKKPRFGILITWSIWPSIDNRMGIKVRLASSDGPWQVRMTASDLVAINNYAGALHLNFETFAPNPLKPGKFMIAGNSHIFIFD